MLDLKWLGAHASQMRSLDTVGATLRYVPGGQAWPTSWHAALLSTGENVAPRSQTAQIRSWAWEPFCTRPWPAEHVDQGAQAPLPTVPLKCPGEQLVHTRSLELKCFITQPAIHSHSHFRYSLARWTRTRQTLCSSPVSQSSRSSGSAALARRLPTPPPPPSPPPERASVLPPLPFAPSSVKNVRPSRLVGGAQRSEAP